MAGDLRQRWRGLELVLNIEHLARVWGLDRLGFLNFTFQDNVADSREAQRRWNSLRSHALAGRYETWVVVKERQKRGAWHWHGAVACREAIRPGFNFEALAKADAAYAHGMRRQCYRWTADYVRSVNPALRAEWDFWKGALASYGFGRMFRFVPVESAGGCGCYLAKYMAKQFGTRQEDAGGVRLVQYAQNFPRVVHGCFTPLWYGQIRRRRISQFCALFHLNGELALKAEFDRWVGTRRHRRFEGWHQRLWGLFSPVLMDEIVFKGVLEAMRADLRLYGGVCAAWEDAMRDLAEKRRESSCKTETG